MTITSKSLSFVCVLFIIVMGPVFCRIGEDQVRRENSTIDVIGKVTRISDGDTIRVSITSLLDEDEIGDEVSQGEEIKVRLHGIDAPEISQECVRSGQPFKCGVEATNILRITLGVIGGEIGGRDKRTVPVPVPVTCDLREKDRYSRWVAVCYYNGQDISRAMVLRGYAVAFVKYSSDYVREEREAKGWGHGLWDVNTEWVDPSEYRRERKGRRR